MVKRYTTQGFRIHVVEVHCKVCRRSEGVIEVETHIGQEVSVDCPRCSRHYDLGDVSSAWLFGGGGIPKPRAGFPEVSANQVTITVPQDGLRWDCHPVVVFPLELAE